MRNSSCHKSILALIAALSIVLTLFSGCGDKAPEENGPDGTSTDQSVNQSGDKSAGLYTIQVFSTPLKVVKTSSDTDIGKVLREKFNVEFEFMPITGDQREKQNIMLASGDYPEILRLEGDDMVKKYIQAGAVAALDDYLPDAVNFTTRFKEQIPYWRAASPDDKLYSWNQFVPQDFMVSPYTCDISVRTDALEKLGWPNLVSEDEWFEFLKRAMKEIPVSNGQKTIGMACPFGESWGPALTNAFIEKGGTYIDVATNDAVMPNYETQRFEPVFTNKYVIENYRWMNKLYREGILDKDCFTDTGVQVANKMNTGRTISVFYDSWDINGANKELQNAGHPEMQYIEMPIRTNEQVKENKKRLIRVETTRPFDSVVITKNAKDPQRLFQMVDWCLSDEGQILLQSGVENKHYKIVEGKRVPTEEFKQGVLSNPEYLEKMGMNLYSYLGHCQERAKDGIAYNLTLDATYADELFLTDRQKEAFKKLGWANSKEYWFKTGESAPSGLLSSCSLDPASEEGKLNVKFNAWRAKAGAKLLTAKSEADFEAALKNVMAEYEKLDIQKVVDRYNEILDELKAKLESSK